MKSIINKLDLSSFLEHFASFLAREKPLFIEGDTALHFRFIQKLSEIEDLRFIGRAPDRASVISFLLGEAHPYDVASILDRFGIAVRSGHHCTQPLMDHLGIPGTARASFALYNTFEEVDPLCDALKRAATMLQ